MDIITSFGSQALDFVFIAVFFYILLKNLPLGRLGGAFKGAILVVCIWFITRIFHFQLSETILGNIIEYGFLALMILFPLEFRKLMENLGRRRVFNWNTKGLIDMDSRKELATAVINLARRKEGGLFVIARQDTLDDLSNDGVYVGESEIHHEFLELAFHRDSKIKQGAVIIKDDAIVSTNVYLPVAVTRKLEQHGLGDRHLAGLGVVHEYDCMAIIVSESTGNVTIIGRINGIPDIDLGRRIKYEDFQQGIDEAYIINQIEYYLKGTDTRKPKGQDPKEAKRAKKEQQRKERPKKEPKVKKK